MLKLETVSEESHVSHLTPSLVISVGSIWILSIVRTLDVEFRVIGVVRIEFDLSLECTHVLSMDLKCKRPESTFPNHTCFRVLNSNVILIIYTLRADSEVIICYVEPETNHNGAAQH